MKKVTIILIILTIFAKCSGFLREIALSYFYGVSYISDAYLISTTIPSVIISFIGIGINTGFIPIYSKIEKNEGVECAIRFTNKLLSCLFIVFTLIILLALPFTNSIVKMFALGFEGETLELAVDFTRVSLFSVYFTGSIYVYSGFLNLRGNYIAPVLVALPLNIVTIVSIFISTRGNILLLAIGTLLATASQYILILPCVHKNEFRHKFIMDFADKDIKNLAYISLPIMLGMSVSQINTLIDRTIASKISIGGISSLNYANKLNLFIYSIFVISIITVMYPSISRMSAANDNTGFKKAITESMNAVNLFVIPASVGAMVFSKPIVKMLFGRGAFDAIAVNMTGDALFYYSIGMVGVGLREVLSRAFYSMQDTKTPMINATIGMVLNIVLNLILSRYMGISGLALATSIAATIITILLFINLRKRIGPFGMKHIAITFAKILVASLIMGLIAWFSFNYLIGSISQNLSLLIAIVIGVSVYFTIVCFMKIEDVDVIVKAVKEKLRKANN